MGTQEPSVPGGPTVGFEARSEGLDIVAGLIRTNLPKWSEVIWRAGLKLAE